jgi:hypothetical protein
MKFNFKNFLLNLGLFFIGYELVYYLVSDEMTKKSLFERILFSAFVAVVFTFFFSSRKRKKNRENKTGFKPNDELR